MDSFNTWAEVLRYVEATYSNPKALNSRGDEGWKSISTHEFIETVRAIALGLREMGINRGDRVGILANPSPEWTMADMAIIVSGAVAVPLFANISDENFLYEVTQTELKVLFVEGQEQWSMFERHQERFTTVIAIDAPRPHKSLSFQDLIEKGKHIHISQPLLYNEMLNGIRPEDLASIIYTSGSTGIPKGAMLTQYNLASVVCFDKFGWDHKKDRYLSVLPLAHVLGHCINFWMITWGISIYYSNDYKKLGEIAKEVKPTVLVVVPRLLEKVYAKMLDKMHSSQGIKRKIGEKAFNLAKKQTRSLFEQLLFPLYDKLVYSKLRHALGGSVRAVISGGAALNPLLHHFYNTIGIPIYEGWGLTEACPVCVNNPAKNKSGTVGPAIIGQEVRIGPDQEVFVKGTLVMKGYYRNPEQTLNTIDPEGWLHTGDRGSLDEDGYLTILGRMKELYKTSTGEYVAPVPIEQAICRNPLIDMAMVVAEGRKFTSCLLFPNMDMLARKKGELNSQNISDQDFLETPDIKTEIKQLLEEVNKHLNHWEQVQEYRFIMEPLTIQGGEITPSMKIRREVVAKKYAPLIESIYHEEGE